MLNTILSIISGLILTIVGVVIGELAIYHLLRALEKPKLIISTARRENKLGFSVSVKKKMVKDARVRCNNINYFWEEKDGKEIERKDLFVGDSPSFFFPFQVDVEYVTDLFGYPNVMVLKCVKEYSGGILITVKELKSQKIVYQLVYAIPIRTRSMIGNFHYANKPVITASVRIIGEGIEQEKDYSLCVGLNRLVIPAIKEGKPIMDYVSYSFELKKKSFF